MKASKVQQYIILVTIISLAISILVHFDSILDQFEPVKGRLHHYKGPESLTHVIADIFVTFWVGFGLFMLNYYLLKPINNTKRIGFMKAFTVIIITLLMGYILSDIFFSLKNYLIPSPDLHHHDHHMLYTLRDLVIIAVVLISVFAIRFINEKQTIKIENERLKRENLQSQYESLKNQVSPHFLFNSLSALNALISDNPEKARSYVNHLSLVLRSALQRNEDRTVTLTSEMEVVSSYLFLIGMRFGSNLVIETNTNAMYNNFRLPPLAVQMLIENAVKHNEISKRNPLTITIKTTDKESLIVSNPIQKKLSPESGTGTGLVNLSRQYQLLCGQDIIISKEDNEFRVEIPLLNPQTYESSIS